MKAQVFDKFEFFAGVPDSLLSPLCDWIYDTKGVGKNHIVAANEGNAAAIAAGYHLATGKIPVVYLQNSGIGNIVNPVVSLTDPKVYGIPILFIVGWRGEPGVKDEPQHGFQGEITLALLENIGLKYFVIEKHTAEEDFNDALSSFEAEFKRGRSCCFVVKKGALSYERKPAYKNSHNLSREDAIKQILSSCGNSVIVATTGKISREVYENRKTHEKDFLVVGSMGHASSVALGLALNTDKNVIILDGDGAALMHTGALAVIGQSGAKNITHIVLNNAAHESVGGLPTVAGGVDFPAVAKAFGYARACSVETLLDLGREFTAAAAPRGPAFVEIKVALGSREDLARPKESPMENKREFVQDLAH